MRKCLLQAVALQRSVLSVRLYVPGIRAAMMASRCRAASTGSR